MNIHEAFEKEWDDKIATYEKDLLNGGNLALTSLLYEIKLHNYTIDDVKSVIQSKLYEAEAKADHNSGEQFNNV
jgi:hypothetical protein